MIRVQVEFGRFRYKYENGDKTHRKRNEKIGVVMTTSLEHAFGDNKEFDRSC